MNELPYWRLSAVYFSYLAVLGGFIPYWNLYLERQLHFTPALIGKLMAITMVTRLLAPGFWGRLADHTGRSLSLVRLGTLMVALLWCGMYFVRAWWAIVLMLLASSFFQNAILAPFEAVTVAHLGSRREQYGRIRLWGSLGFMVMVAGLGSLFDVISLRWLPAILAGTALVTCFASLNVPDIATPPRANNAASLWSVLRRPAVMGFLGASFLLQVAHAPYYSFYSIFLEAHHYSRAAIGGLWALGIAAEVVAFTQMHRILPLLGERRVLLGALLLSALRWWGIGQGIDQPHTLIVMQLLHAASFAAFHSACISLISQHFGSGNQGQGQAVYGMLWGLGTALGAYGAGHAWTALGPATIFGAAACISLLGWFWAHCTVHDESTRSIIVATE